MQKQILILFFAIISFNCFSQITTKPYKMLFVEKNTKAKWQATPFHTFFIVGDRIKIERFSNDTVLSGKINFINDSSLVLKKDIILVKDIKEINFVRGGTAIVGAAILVSSVALTLSNKIFFEQGIIPFGAGLVTFGVGIIRLLLTKHYRMDKKFTITIKPTDIKDRGHCF